MLQELVIYQSGLEEVLEHGRRGMSPGDNEYHRFEQNGSLTVYSVNKYTGEETILMVLGPGQYSFARY